jgi:hypothetical protein
MEFVYTYTLTLHATRLFVSYKKYTNKRRYHLLIQTNRGEYIKNRFREIHSNKLLKNHLNTYMMRQQTMAAEINKLSKIIALS